MVDGSKFKEGYVIMDEKHELGIKWNEELISKLGETV